MSAAAAGQDSVLEINFEQDASAYQALTNIKELAAQERIDVRAAAVVVRSDDGHLIVKDQVGGGTITGSTTGGILGLLIGVLGGPFGVLIGGATGLLIGSLFDLEDDVGTESVLSEISNSVRSGHTALLAEVREPSPEVIDSAMAALSGTVVRRPTAEVEAEIAAAADAQRAAARQARKELFEQRRKKQKQEIDDRVEDLKTKLRGHKETKEETATAATT